MEETKDFRCLWRLGPPLTIPNREVKPTCADGTALLRVGEYVDATFYTPNTKVLGVFFLQPISWRDKKNLYYHQRE